MKKEEVKRIVRKEIVNIFTESSKDFKKNVLSLIDENKFKDIVKQEVFNLNVNTDSVNDFKKESSNLDEQYLSYEDLSYEDLSYEDLSYEDLLVLLSSNIKDLQIKTLNNYLYVSFSVFDLKSYIGGYNLSDFNEFNARKYYYYKVKTK